MEDKVINGIIHCANYVCNGCPYKPEATEMHSGTSSYVHCMQKLIEDVYKNIKEVEE